MRLANAVGLGLGVAAIGLRAAVRRSLPKPGLIRIAALDDEVEILRDHWGVPHVYARTEHDLFFANGVVHGEDRLWQMELNRRAATGRLSEMFGERTVGVDRFMRHVGLHRAAQMEVGGLDTETAAILDAYVAGINWAIEARPRPFEFLLLRHHAPPWTRVDVLAWAKLMAWGLSVNWDTELARTRLLRQLGAETAAELEPLYPAGGWLSSRGEAITRAAGSILKSYAELHELTGLGSLGGSNAWAVAPSRSATGSALLANDMHLAPQLPSVWYEIGLECGELKVVGTSLPGLPGVVVGHNQHIAWGYTASLADVQDLYVERAHPDDPRRFARGDSWEQAEVIREEIRVKGEPRWQTEEVAVSSNGPVITPLLDGIEATLSLRAAPFESAQTLAAGIAVMRARSAEELRSAFVSWGTPSLGVVFADVQGNIGFQITGLLPRRRKGDGALPSPGWDPAYSWDGFVPFDELPYSLNPPEGFVATANNQPHGDDYPHPIGCDWCDAYRIGRVVELLQATPKHDAESFKAIQLDVRSNAARDVIAATKRILGDEQPVDPLERESLRLLLGWDGSLHPDSAPAAIYELFRSRLLRFLYAPQLGDGLDIYLGGAAHPGGGGSSFAWRASSRLISALADPEWPEKRGHPGLGWREVILIALGEAVSELRLAHGEEIGTWSWGRIHQLTFEHPMGKGTPLGRWLNRGSFGVGGDLDTPCQIGASHSRADGAVTWLPSYRQVVDLSDLTRSVSVHTVGQSGHPSSKHYDDLIPLWLSGGYHPMLWERADVEEHLESETRLLPTDELWPRP